VPTYNLFIPLQNVTAEMGATWICPGTHMCSESSFCSETGFQASGHNNNVPLGYGIFLNQQLSHRGGAHRDPNGPQRVVFIITFAPRPRVFRPHKTVETRKIGLGGSYSQHVSQWGHTLSDYQQSLKYMKQPFRMLRSLGIYNNRGNTRWGWDYVTVCTGSLANDDYTCPSVQELKHKIKKAKSASMKLYQLCMMVHILYLLLFACVPRRRLYGLSRYLLRNVVRVGTIHMLVLCAVWFLRQSIIDSTWGRNIQAKRSFRLPEQSFALTSSLRATLPDRHDILIFEGMHSDSTIAHTRAIESTHPGNREWNLLVKLSAPEYDNLSPTLQEHIRRHMLDTVQQESRRILIQNEQLNWTQVSTELGHVVIHKSLLQMSNRHIHYVIQSLDNIISETRYGYWRNTALYRTQMSAFLNQLHVKIIGVLRQRVSTEKSTVAVARQKSPNLMFLSYGILPIKHALKKELASLKCGAVSCHPKQAIPWLNVGDIVEATFGTGEFLGKQSYDS
jgi:hypothetical protein